MMRATNYQNNGHYNEYIILNKLWLKVFGFNEGYLLSVLHNWLLNKEKSGTDIYEGRAWVRCSYQQWEEYLPFKKSVLNTILTKLKDMNILLETDRLNYDRRDRTKWYSINYEMIMYYEKAYKQEINLVTVVVEKEKEQKAFSANHNFRKVDNAYSENRNMHIPKSGDCIVQNSDNAYSEIQNSEYASNLDISVFNNTPNIKSNKLNNNSVCGCNTNTPKNKNTQKNGNQEIIKQMLNNLNRTLIMLTALINGTEDRNKVEVAGDLHIQEQGSKESVKNEKQEIVIQTLKQYAVSDAIIQKLLNLHNTEEKLQDLIEFLQDDYFKKYITSVPAFMKYVVENNCVLKKTFREVEKKERTERATQKSNKTAKCLREERDPSVYTSLEELYKRALRGNTNETEEETMSITGISSIDQLLRKPEK